MVLDHAVCPALEAVLTKCPKPCSRKTGNAAAMPYRTPHLVPIVDAQVVEGRHRHDAGIAEENIELAIPLASQLDELGYVVASFHIYAHVGHVATRCRDAVSKRLEAIRTARNEHDLRAALGEQERWGLANPAACARDCDNLVFDS
jgi:hypothetical protein